ncbi:MAG: prepilin-type N-terminal cleavage/methylation domain-containing protein [bacterium]|nr:prepilin-type N-terminal cleavage/methylation domain-containing protein [bacterium]
MKGFTLTELIVVIALAVLLGGLALPALRIAQKNSELQATVESLVSVLRLAQNRTLGSEGASQYGVFFDTAASPDQYILFKGATYATRNVAADEPHVLPQSVEMSTVTIPGSAVVFARVTGAVLNAGGVTLRLVADPAKEESVYVSTSGSIQKTSAFVASDQNRQKDSRHVHADYAGRTIATETESVRLVFLSTTYDIPIASNMKDGQIFWEGDILVDGATQTLQVQTHRLNDPALGTQFSIVRDKSKNTKALNIEISGDGTGDIVRYDVQGQTTKGSSLYVSLPLWQ